MTNEDESLIDIAMETISSYEQSYKQARHISRYIFKRSSEIEDLRKNKFAMHLLMAFHRIFNEEAIECEKSIEEIVEDDVSINKHDYVNQVLFEIETGSYEKEMLKTLEKEINRKSKKEKVYLKK